MYGAADIAFDARAVVASAASRSSPRARSAPHRCGRREAVRRLMRFAARPRRPPTRAGGDSAAAWPWPKSLSRSCCLQAPSLSSEPCASLMSVDLGVRADRVLVIGVDWPNDQAQADRRVPLLQQYDQAFRALPGVESVAVTTGVPGSMPRHRSAELIIDGLDVPEKNGYIGSHVMASPGIFFDDGHRSLAGRAVHCGRSFLRAESRRDQRELCAQVRITARRGGRQARGARSSLGGNCRRCSRRQAWWAHPASGRNGVRAVCAEPGRWPDSVRR